MSGALDPERLAATERIAQVRARFLANLPARLEGLAALALKAGGDAPEAQEAREALRIGLHNLSGSAPTLGLVEIGRLAGEIERRVISKQLPNGGLAPPVASEVAHDVSALGDVAPEAPGP